MQALGRQLPVGLGRAEVEKETARPLAAEQPRSESAGGQVPLSADHCQSAAPRGHLAKHLTCPGRRPTRKKSSRSPHITCTTRVTKRSRRTRSGHCSSGHGSPCRPTPPGISADPSAADGSAKARTGASSIYSRRQKTSSTPASPRSARSAAPRERPRSGGSRKAHTARAPEVCAGIEEIPTVIEGFAPYHQVKLKRDKALWALKLVKDLGVPGVAEPGTAEGCVRKRVGSVLEGWTSGQPAEGTEVGHTVSHRAGERPTGTVRHESRRVLR